MINDRYSILDKIGEGRSKVFSCSDKFNPDTKFAIKILSFTSNTDEQQSFNNEYALLRKLDHPNIINVFSKGKILSLDEHDKNEFSISENDIFFVMEYIEGVNIDQVSEIKRESTFLNILDQLAAVLYYLHQANYIYFDIKPENIIVESTKAKPIIKLIDFGLSSYLPDLKDEFSKGTAEYLAPEILRNEKPDQRADLYSLGILLYKLAYGKLPFNTNIELEIYHTHLEKNFEFPSCRYSSKTINVIKKLLAKDPNNRYSTTLEIYKDLEREISQRSKSSFNSLFQFVPDKKLVEQVNEFLDHEPDSNLLILRGVQGSGKTDFLEYISNQYPNSALINISGFIRNKNFWVQFFNKLIYSEFLYKKIDESIEHYISIHLEDSSENLLSELKSIFAKISKQNDFILIVDDLEKTNRRIIEFFNEILPILQANDIKVILSQNLETEELVPQLGNKIEIEMQPFTDEVLKKVVESSYFETFPKKTLAEILLSYSHRNPKDLSNFIFNMIVSGIIDYNSQGVEIHKDPELINSIVKTQENIYKKIYNDLLLTELSVLETISIFKEEVSTNIIAAILGLTKRDIILIISDLRDKNILKSVVQNINPIFGNEGFKKFVYQNISDSKALHLRAANTLREMSLAETYAVIIDQYELAEKFDLAKEIIDEALKQEGIIGYPRLSRRLLERKLSYELEEIEKIKSSLELVEVLLNLSEFKSAQMILNSVPQKLTHEDLAINRDKLFGIILINLGEINEGLKLITKVSEKIKDGQNKILFEMASAHLELNNFDESYEICELIIDAEDKDLELLGRVYNLLGLISLYKGDDLKIVLEYFNSAFSNYTKLNNLMRIASIQVNIGNIQNMMGNFSEAEKNWNKALQINQSIGNVDQEARLLLNYGIFNYEHADFEEAIDLYQRSGKIFRGLGNKNGYGLVLTNLGESFLITCEYQKCLDSLKRSKEIFEDLHNNAELSESLIILAKLYYKVGNNKKLILTLSEIKNCNDQNLDDLNPMVRFFEIIEEFSKDFSESLLNELFDILQLLKEKSLIFTSIEIKLIISEILISHEKIETAKNLLESDDLIEYCKTNLYLDANRNFLQSRIVEAINEEESLQELTLLKKGIELLEKLSITELTIATLFSFSNYYFIRGNLKKAYEHIILYLNMLEYIIENIKSPEIRDSYINKSQTQKYLTEYKNLKI